MTATDPLATADLQERAHRHLLMHFTRNGAFGPGGKPLLVLERGEGPYVFDTDGKRYFDGLSSLFCAQIGYSFGEEMAAASAQQLTTLAFNTNWATAHPPAIDLAEAIAERAPGDLNRVFFTNGGSEAVEAAWKIVRQSFLGRGEPQRTKAIAREIAYHGVTLGALSFTGVRTMKEPFGAAPIPVVRVPNTNAFRADPAEDDAARRPPACSPSYEAAIVEAGPGDRRDDHRRARPERRRLPRPARGLLGRPAGARRQVRDRARRRRGHHGLRAHRRVVRRPALRRHAGRDHLRQGHHLGLRADGRRDRLRPDRRAALRGGPDAAARHHLRRPSRSRPRWRCATSRSSSARACSRTCARTRATSATACASCRTACRSSATCAARATSGRSSWSATRRATRFSADERERLLRGFLTGRLLEEGLIARPDDRGDAVLHLAPPLISGEPELDEMVAKTEAVLADASERFFAA